jgi:hypothetical protein
MNVAQAFHNLTTTTKPAPIEVFLTEPKLAGGAEFLRYWLAVGIILQFRTAVVWGFLALFFPQFGATWIMVMFALWAIRHLVPVAPKQIIKAIAAQRR